MKRKVFIYMFNIIYHVPMYIYVVIFVSKILIFDYIIYDFNNIEFIYNNISNTTWVILFICFGVLLLFFFIHTLFIYTLPSIYDDFNKHFTIKELKKSGKKQDEVKVKNVSKKNFQIVRCYVKNKLTLVKIDHLFKYDNLLHKCNNILVMLIKRDVKQLNHLNLFYWILGYHYYNMEHNLPILTNKKINRVFLLSNINIKKYSIYNIGIVESIITQINSFKQINKKTYVFKTEVNYFNYVYQLLCLVQSLSAHKLEYKSSSDNKEYVQKLDYYLVLFFLSKKIINYCYLIYNFYELFCYYLCVKNLDSDRFKVILKNYRKYSEVNILYHFLNFIKNNNRCNECKE